MAEALGDDLGMDACPAGESRVWAGADLACDDALRRVTSADGAREALLEGAQLRASSALSVGARISASR
jgi:hypothetical protein